MTYKFLNMMSFFLFFLLGPTYGSAQPADLAPTDFISLSYDFDSDSDCGDSRNFFRVFANGVKGGVPFKVPTGSNLIVTDVPWQALPSPRSAFVANEAVRFVVQVLDGTRKRTVFYSTPVLVTTANTSALIGGGEHLVTGFRVGQQRFLCADAFSQGISFFLAHSAGTVQLMGYLVDKP
jgi:hypothetical protein